MAGRQFGIQNQLGGAQPPQNPQVILHPRFSLQSNGPTEPIPFDFTTQGTNNVFKAQITTSRKGRQPKQKNSLQRNGNHPEWQKFLTLSKTNAPKPPPQ